MNLSLSSILSFFQSFSPILLPVGAYLIALVIHHIPGTRLAKLQQIASTVVPAIEQQANGGWTNEQKYNAAAQAVNLLAAKFGYRVNPAEVKLLIEGAVAGFKSLESSTSVLSASSTAQSASMASAPTDAPTQTADPVAGAV